MHAFDIYRVSPAELLQQANAVLLASWPTLKGTFSRDGINCVFRFDHPGVLRVYERNTGALMAQSQPGRPTRPKAVKKAFSRGAQ